MNKKIYFLSCIFFISVQIFSKTIYITLPEQFLSDPHAERDERSKHFYDLKNALNKLGYEVKSLELPQQIYDEFDFIIFVNPPEPYLYEQMKNYPREKCICTTWEPPTVRPDYYANDLSGYFLYNLVMFDDLVDHSYFLKLFYPQPTLHMHSSDNLFNAKKLCCLIAKYWRSNYKYELYSQRKEAILFFNTYYPHDLDLYGAGWPDWLHVYKGTLFEKRSALHQYRFCICYENTYDLNGYITEKIFDCFVAGCVPVYWGASNVTDYIPKNCFIDRREFSNNEELYIFLKNMSEDGYVNYLTNIEQFLKSDQAFLFSTEYFVDKMLSIIMPGYPKEKIFSTNQIEKILRVKEIIINP